MESAEQQSPLQLAAQERNSLVTSGVHHHYEED